MGNSNNPLRLFTLLMLLLALITQAHCQRDILVSNLNEYGKGLKFVTSWTDDDFIVMLTRGDVGQYGYKFFLIDPDKGIVSTYEVPDKMNMTTYRVFSSSAESITIFYKVQETGKAGIYALTFSKSTNTAERQSIPEEIKDIEKESYFRCIVDGRLLFASITKDHKRFALREITPEGVAQVVHLVDLPEELYDYFKNNALGPSSPTLERNVSIHDQTLRVILEDREKKDIILNVFEIDLRTRKVNVYSRSEVNRYNSYEATFAGDSLYIMKTIKAGVSMGTPGYMLFMEVLAYPSMERVRFFSVDQSMKDIPFKTSHLTKVNYSTGLYHSGRNREYEDLDEHGPDVNRTLKEITRASAYIRAWKSAQGNTLLMLGSRSDVFITNTEKTNNSYFFGCLDRNLDPCVVPNAEKSPAEKMSDYLTSIQKEKPVIYEFGFQRSFVAFKLKSSDAIVIKEF